MHSLRVKLHNRTSTNSCSPVFVLLGAPPPVFIVVELRAGVSLSAQSRWFLARLSFVVCQHVRRVQPLRIIIEQGALLVQAVGAHPVIVAVHHLPLFSAVVHWWSEIICSVGECTMWAIFDAETSAIIRVLTPLPDAYQSDLLSVSWTHMPVL